MTRQKSNIAPWMLTLMLSFGVAGCSLLKKAPEQTSLIFPQRPTIVFDKLCKDDHDAGVKLSQRECSEYEYSLDSREVAALLHYFIELERLEALNR